MGTINLFVDDDDVQAADAASQFCFEPPKDAVRRGNLDDPNDDKARATWVQRLQVTEARWYEDTAKDKTGNTYPCIVAEVSFQTPPDARRGAEPDPNAGRSHRAWYRIVPAAMKEKQHPKYKSNNFNLGRMHGIIRSVWGSNALPKGTRVDLSKFFDGQPAPIVGKMIVCTMEGSRYEGKRKDELTDFVPLELIGSHA
jgi:hypothetical protein